MSNHSAESRSRRYGLRWAGVAAAVAGTALAAACGGGSHPAAPAAAPGQGSVQRLDAFAQCLRSHGEPGFYFSNPQSTPSSSGTVLSIMGHQVIGIDPRTAQFASAMKSCKHLLPHGGPPPVSQKQLNSMVKFAACMRAHGFPGYPDPERAANGAVDEQPLPSSIDTSSPQFQAAEKACGD